MIGLDELQTGAGRSAFVEDCRSEALKLRCKQHRLRWWDAMKKAGKERPNSPEYSEHHEDGWADMKAAVPGLGQWERDWAGVAPFLPTLEASLAPFDARPHWGKLFAMPTARVQALYARLPDFRRLAQSLDPRGKFRNAFLDRYIFGEENAR